MKGMPGMSLPADFDIAEYVRKSTEAQQLPEKLDDPSVLARIIALLGQAAK